MTFGERLKLLRITKKLTQKQFGEMIGLKQNSIALIESDKRNASDSAIIALLSAFPDVNQDWLINGTGEMLLPLTVENMVLHKVKNLLGNADSKKKTDCIYEILCFNDEQWNELFCFVSGLINNKNKDLFESESEIEHSLNSIISTIVRREVEKVLHGSNNK